MRPIKQTSHGRPIENKECMKNLEKHEFQITGDVNDEVTKRINWLTNEVLNKYATCGAGWSTVCIDPTTGFYWKRDLPHSQLHGGGPPRLTRIDSIDNIQDLKLI